MATPLSVLIPVDHAVGISGPHRNVVGSLNALGRRDDVRMVLLTGMIDESEPYASAPNIEVHLGFHPHDPKRIATNLWRMRRAARGCDVIYVPSGLKALLYAQTVHPSRRLVAGPNVTPLPIGNRGDSPGIIELKYLSDAWFEASRARRDHVRRVTGNASVSYIHHAIDTKRFSPKHNNDGVWDTLGVPGDRLKALYVGKDYALKGVSQLLDAATTLVATCPDVHFVLVGTMTDETLARATALPNVTFVGFRMGNELPALYASADLSVVPSSWEGFGFTVLEAMASGVPVIGSNAGAIPELIRDGETGLIVDIVAGRNHLPDAGARIAGAISRLATDPGMRKQLGSAARQRVLAEFSETRLGNDLMAIFRNEPRPDSP